MNMMKKLLKATGIGFLICACASPAMVYAQAAGGKAGGQKAAHENCVVLADLRLIELDEQAAEDLFEGKLSSVYTVDAAKLSAIREMMKKNAARSAGRMRLASRSGQNAEIKGIAECRYPSEYAEMGWTAPTAAQGTNEASVSWVQGGQGVIPADFETRDVGYIFNFTPALNQDGSRISVTMLPQKTQCPFFRDVSTGGPGGNVWMQQPEFYVLTTATAVDVQNGETVLISAATPPGNDGDKIVLFLLTVSIPGN